MMEKWNHMSFFWLIEPSNWRFSCIFNRVDKWNFTQKNESFIWKKKSVPLYSPDCSLLRLLLKTASVLATCVLLFNFHSNSSFWKVSLFRFSVSAWTVSVNFRFSFSSLLKKKMNLAHCRKRGQIEKMSIGNFLKKKKSAQWCYDEMKKFHNRICWRIHKMKKNKIAENVENNSKKKIIE